MARKKNVKPLMAVKHDFVDSLDNFVQKTILLQQVCRSIADERLNPTLPKPLRDALVERMADFEQAFMSEETE